MSRRYSAAREMDAVAEIMAPRPGARGGKRAIALFFKITEPGVRSFWRNIPAERVLGLEAMQILKLKRDKKPLELARMRWHLRPDLHPMPDNPNEVPRNALVDQAESAAA